MLESSHNFYSMLQSSGNILLHRDDLGKKKPGIHTLPSTDFVYGKFSGQDKEGARDLMKHWQLHKSSAKLQPEADVKLLNSMSAMNGLSTATEFRSFRKGKDIQMRTPRSQSKMSLFSPEITYGKALRPATPINAVVSNFYGRVSVATQHEAYTTNPAPKICKWNSTRGFELLKSAKSKAQEKLEVKAFKMKKFSDIASRTDCWRPK